MLAGGNPAGMALIPAGHGGAWNSLWAAVLCLPAFIAMRLIAWAGSAGPTSGIAFALAAELCGYVITWVGYALATRPLAEATGRLAEWPRFVAAWGWSHVVQYLVFIALAAASALGLPLLLDNALGLAAIGYMLWLEWFIAKEALRITGGRAVVFVLLDMLFGIFVFTFAGKLYGA
jgi:hypothetical protein